MVTVGRLWQYPVKSMQGETVDEVQFGPGGALGDRAYGFVDVATARLVSAKHPKRYGAMLGCRAAFVSPPRAGEPSPPVRVTFPDGECIEGDTAAIGRRVSELLGREVRMVTSVAEGVAYEEVWPVLEGFGPDDFYGALQITGADDDAAGERILGIPTGMAAPGTLLDFAALHVLTTGTLSALAGEHPGGQWDERRFRPNVVFDTDGDDGAVSYVEDGWIGCDLVVGPQVRIHVVAHTPRCVMPTLAQPDLTRDPEILQTVARVNRRDVGPLGRFACAGAYGEVVTTGVVRAGDPVTVDPQSMATESDLADAAARIIELLSAARGTAR